MVTCPVPVFFLVMKITRTFILSDNKSPLWESSGPAPGWVLGPSGEQNNIYLQERYMQGGWWRAWRGVHDGRSQRRGHLSRDLVEVDVWERTVQEEGTDGTKVPRQCVGPLGLP